MITWDCPEWQKSTVTYTTMDGRIISGEVVEVNGRTGIRVALGEDKPKWPGSYGCWEINGRAGAVLTLNYNPLDSIMCSHQSSWTSGPVGAGSSVRAAIYFTPEWGWR